MLVLLVNFYSQLEAGYKRDKQVWSKLVAPILIVYFKMMAEVFFRRAYVDFFAEDNLRKAGLGHIFNFITDIFDSSQMQTELTFWLKTTKNSKDSHTFNKMRMHAISPTVEYLYEHPNHFQARKMVANNRRFNSTSNGLANIMKRSRSSAMGYNVKQENRFINRALNIKLSQLTLEKVFK